ncbi:MAG: glycosyltransferase family 2 protein [Actinomycetota bacterium]|nr:glycosyltransferase family 2 protein [Actinomycetota bacterium]MCL6092911.1 glycosyltransferase family 2 protein [Actinomycetota bacterium]MDA8166483.1 glycosyltransferase family 2 protein [Actinomycetota bacterium]
MRSVADIEMATRPAGAAEAVDAPARPSLAVELSIVIPVFNEEERIVSTVCQISDYLARQERSYEVIISDDGSRDDGPELVRQHFARRRDVRLIRERTNRGKGAAVRRGVLAARGDLIIFTDADLSYPVETISRCVDALKRYDLAIGSRNLPDSEIATEPPLLRRLAGPAFKTLVRQLALRGFTDTQCGFKGFRAQAAHDIFINCCINGYAFDVEVLGLARRFGYSVTEVPVRLLLDSSDSHINLTTDPLRMILDLLRIRARLSRAAAAADEAVTEGK